MPEFPHWRQSSGEYSDYDYILDGIREEGIYGYYDINEDGVDELVTRTVGGMKIFQYQDNRIKEISRMIINGTVWRKTNTG